MVKPGDKVTDPIVTIESGQVKSQIPSPSSGEIKDLKVKIEIKFHSLDFSYNREWSSYVSAEREKRKRKLPGKPIKMEILTS